MAPGMRGEIEYALEVARILFEELTGVLAQGTVDLDPVGTVIIGTGLTCQVVVLDGLLQRSACRASEKLGQRRKGLERG